MRVVQNVYLLVPGISSEWKMGGSASVAQSFCGQAACAESASLPPGPVSRRLRVQDVRWVCRPGTCVGDRLLTFDTDRLQPPAFQLLKSWSDFSVSKYSTRTHGQPNRETYAQQRRYYFVDIRLKLLTINLSQCFKTDSLKLSSPPQKAEELSNVEKGRHFFVRHLWWFSTRPV